MKPGASFFMGGLDRAVHDERVLTIHFGTFWNNNRECATYRLFDRVLGLVGLSERLQPLDDLQPRGAFDVVD